MQADNLWLPSIISDNMVLQAGKRAAIWGRAYPGQTVRVELSEGPGSAARIGPRQALSKVAGRHAKAVAAADGTFLVRLPAMPPGGPYRLTIRAHGERIIENVLVGEVWLGSGQSNMEWSVAASNDAPAEIAAATWPRIRIFTVPPRASRNPCHDVQGRWDECSPDTVGDFSALMYYFGRSLHQSLKVPLGLINASWGGSSIEPWIAVDDLQKCEAGRPALRQYAAELAARPEGEEDFREDRYNHGVALGWAGRRCPSSGWQRIELPAYWSPKVNKAGAFWFRKSVRPPRSWAGQCLCLSLGAIVDFDTTYFNGHRIGGIGRETPGAWQTPRRYVIPAQSIRSGTNIIAVRAFGHNNGGGFSGPKDEMTLSVVNRPELGTIPLDGQWQYRPEREFEPLGRMSSAAVPGTLLNAMIHPVRHYTLRGFLWYQGESNVDQPAAYRELHPLMIRQWRRLWRDADLGFYFVQLPDYASSLGDNNLPLLREAQAASLSLPHTGMAVTIDGGEADVHVRNKQMQGRRLALQAMTKVYGRRIACSGPVFKRMEIQGRLARISFAHGRGLRLTRGRTPLGFAVAGADRVFLPARARIEGEHVVVWHPQIERPVAVRYAWAAQPQCNLVNDADLPAAPFRTDRWT